MDNMTDRQKMINEFTFQLNSKEVREESSCIQLSVTDAKKCLELLKEQPERKCGHCEKSEYADNRWHKCWLKNGDMIWFMAKGGEQNG